MVQSRSRNLRKPWVGGNLQTDASAAYFLPGVSFAFWRTMYLTLGAGIGSQSELTGGYKVGDTVPPGVTTSCRHRKLPLCTIRLCCHVHEAVNDHEPTYFFD